LFVLLLLANANECAVDEMSVVQQKAKLVQSGQVARAGADQTPDEATTIEVPRDRVEDSIKGKDKDKVKKQLKKQAKKQVERLKADEETQELTGLSRAEHGNRNQRNELPKGQLTATAEDPTMWKDEDGREWKLNAEQNAAYHQPMPVWIAFVRAILGRFIPFLKVPNLKFISKNADGMYSEVCANRYTGELVIAQKIMGTFNLCKDAPNAMKDGKLPTGGQHRMLDIIPHEEYGGTYKQVAKGIDVGQLEKGPVILDLE